MIELGPNARNLIELAQNADDPDAGTRERVQEAFLAKVTASSTTASPLEASAPHGSVSSGAVKLAGSKSLLSWKAGVLLAVAVIGGGASSLSYSRAPDAQEASTQQPDAREASTQQPGAREASTAGRIDMQPTAKSSAPLVASPSVQSPPDARRDGLSLRARADEAPGPPTEAARPERRSERTEPRSSARGALAALPSQSPPPQARARDEAASKESQARAAGATPSPSAPAEEAPAAADGLLAEARALRDAQQALRTGQTSRALILLAEQERRFPGGQLSEARAAARAMASCAKRSAAESAKIATTFSDRWPRSPLTPSVRAACRVEPTSATPRDE